jgi:rRNA processing protein Gar1
MPSKVSLSWIWTSHLDTPLMRCCDQVPYFNAPIYLPSKAAIGKVDEILGPISASPRTSVTATSPC